MWTSAGVTAGIDLALALVEQDLGRSLALAVARHLVVFLKRPGGQAQFSEALTLQSSDDRFAALHDWIGSNLDSNLSLQRLAAQSGMSGRSYGRRYCEATGMTPGRAVERLRVKAARQLLTETSTPVKRIAQRCGFGTEETMRRSFRRVQGVAPADYRLRFPRGIEIAHYKLLPNLHKSGWSIKQVVVRHGKIPERTYARQVHLISVRYSKM